MTVSNDMADGLMLLAAERAVLSELHALLDCIQVDGTVSDLDLVDPQPQSTLGETLRDLLIRYDMQTKILKLVCPYLDLSDVKGS